MNIKTNYGLGEIVFLITDKEQSERIITQINVRPNNTIMYDLSLAGQSSWHYDFEFSSDKNWKK